MMHNAVKFQLHVKYWYNKLIWKNNESYKQLLVQILDTSFVKMQSLVLVNIWWNGSITTHIQSTGTKQRWVVRFMIRPLYPMERTLCAYWIGGWIACRARRDAAVKRSHCSCQESNLAVQSTDSHYSDWATLALLCRIHTGANYARCIET
jgi:hypothetical protein